MFSLEPTSSSKLAMIEFFSVCTARSTTPIRCVASVDYLLFQYFFSQNSIESLDMKALHLSEFIFSGTPQRLMKLFRNLMTSLALVDLHIRTTGRSLYRSIPIRLYGSPPKRFLCDLPEKLVHVSCPSLVKTDRLIFFVIGNCYFNFLLELIQAVYVLPFSLCPFASRPTKICYSRPAVSSSQCVRNVVRLTYISSGITI